MILNLLLFSRLVMSTLLKPHGLWLSGSSVHEIPSQEYWSGFPFPSPGDLPDPEIKSVSPDLVGGFFTAEAPGNTLKPVA